MCIGRATIRIVTSVHMRVSEGMREHYPCFGYILL
uniref:Uncharacterized protein n=1 Tax=Lepeophtheirus salmonis TaxID=72036 RepID=A0A0K2TC11_LEPSM